MRPDSTTAGCRAAGGLAVPFSIDTAWEYLFFIECKLNSTNGNVHVRNQERTGAAFIIQTMIGQATNNPPTAAQLTEWRSRVYAAEAAGQINWNFNWSFNVNSYFQGNPVAGNSSPNDDAFFNGSGSGAAIVFGGSNPYVLRRQCANPVGNGTVGVLPPNANFATQGRTTVDNASPLPGDTIQFRHYVRNNGPDNTAPTAIWWFAQDMPSLVATGGAASSGTYAAFEEKNVFSESVVIPAGTPAGSQICRRVGWDPVTSGGLRDGRGETVCATVRYDFTLTPLINFTVNGTVPVGSIAELGDSITFNYSVGNSGLTQSQLATCNIYGLSRPGSYAAPAPPDSASDGGYVPPPTGCPRTFPYNSTTAVASETITASAVNQTICRAFWVNPASVTVGAVGTETCIRIVAKPYLKVYGGDVAAGSGLETAPDTCTSNTNAAITSWNKRNTGPVADQYAGAGVQYASFALRAITDFATGAATA
jgi:hypothetical protein